MKYSDKILWFVFCLFVGRLSGQSCNTDGLQHFAFADVKQILDDNNCRSCHHKGGGIGWNYDTYDAFLFTSSCQPTLIVHGDAGSSSFIKMISGLDMCPPPFNQSDHTLSPNHIKKIEAWINTGATKSCIPAVEEIVSVLDRHQCYSCHNPVDARGGWFYDQNFDLELPSLIDCGPERVIRQYLPYESSLFTVLSEGEDCYSGDGVHRLDSPSELDKIRDWIFSGAAQQAESLPLELVSFNLRVQDQVPTLHWVTSSEIGVDKFIVERSANLGSFESLGEVASTGHTTNEYFFSDRSNPVGDQYYRIKILDLDGRHEYSPIEFVRLTSNDFVFDVYPNPLINASFVSLKWYSKNDIQTVAKMSLMNSAGEVLQRYRISNGINRVNLPSLSNGMYYLTVEDYYGASHYERIVILNE